MPNFADPKRLEEAARLRTQGVSLRQVSKLTGLHRETILTHTGRGVVSRSESMKIYHARRKGVVIEMADFKVNPIIRPSRFVPIGAPVPIKRVIDPVEARFKQYQPLVAAEANRAIRKMSSLYDLKTLEHFGSIGLWDACRRFMGDEATFPFYARLRIRGQIWDEIRTESYLPRRMLKSENKPRFDDIDEVIVQSNLPLQDDVVHLRDIIQQVDAIPFSDRERQVIEACANGEPLGDLSLSWGVSTPRASQHRFKAIQKMTDLIRKAAL